jgi:hypothetical protein
VTAQDAFQTMLRGQVAPVLRNAGFKKSATTWRLHSPHGDVAVINVQKSRWNTGNEVDFYVNLAIVPAVWWENLSLDIDTRPATPHEFHGLLRRRLDPTAVLPNGWNVRDTDSAGTCGAVLGEQLEHIAIPELRDLLDRDRLVAFLAAGATGWWVVNEPLALAYVIADQGPSRQLNETLDAVESTQPDPRTIKQLEWLRLRAAASQRDD